MAVLTIGLFSCFLIIYKMYLRIRLLVAEMRALKNNMEATDEELSKLEDNIKEFKKLNF